MTSALRDWLPPALVSRLRSHVGTVRFRGDYSSWASAVANSQGYDAREIVDQVERSALAVRDGAVAFERDGVALARIEHTWPVLASLLWIAQQRGGQLHVLDFGGGLGSSYQQNRGFLASLSRLRWSIVEQPHFVASGRRHFEDEILRFYADIPAALAGGRPDVILLSSVLPYVEAPYALLDQVIAHGLDFVLVDRTPFLAEPRDRLCVQRVGARIVASSYPCWFLSEEKFIAHLAPAYSVVEQFESLGNAGPSVHYRGFLFRRRALRS